MEFNCEDLGRVAIMQVSTTDVVFKGIQPEHVSGAEVAVVVKAKIVVSHADNPAQVDALRHSWVLVADGSCDEETIKCINPYITIVRNADKITQDELAVIEANSRGWNVDGEQRKCIVVGPNDLIEVLFGESRENPVGLLSVKCVKK